MTPEKLLSILIIICLFKRVYSVLNHDKYGEVKVRNFFKSAEGKVFSKSGSLLSNQTTKSTKECCFKCVQNKECLSVNTSALDQSRCQCELLNWAGTGFENHLVPKPNSKFMQAKTACSPNPCQNGGQCAVKDAGTNYTCTCVGHTGRNCEINMCVPNPCKNGAKCTVADGGGDYNCSCTNSPAGKNCENCTLFDFESGNLDGWTLTGTAFRYQPTYGDNSLARGDSTANLKGNWYIGTFEKRPSPSDPVGKQDDTPTGTATSPRFKIVGSKLRFLIGGGANTDERLELLIGGSVVDKAFPVNNRNTMNQKEFNVSSYRGQVAQVRIVDDSSSGWGIVNVDHIEDSCTE